MPCRCPTRGGRATRPSTCRRASASRRAAKPAGLPAAPALQQLQRALCASPARRAASCSRASICAGVWRERAFATVASSGSAAARCCSARARRLRRRRRDFPRRRSPRCRRASAATTRRPSCTVDRREHLPRLRGGTRLIQIDLLAHGSGLRRVGAQRGAERHERSQSEGSCTAPEISSSSRDVERRRRAGRFRCARPPRARARAGCPARSPARRSASGRSGSRSSRASAAARARARSDRDRRPDSARRSSMRRVR